MLLRAAAACIRTQRMGRFALSRVFSSGSDAAVEELDAKVTSEQANALGRFHSDCIDTSLEQAYNREKSDGGTDLYKQNEKDVQVLFREILKTKDTESVNHILQRWLKQQKSSPCWGTVVSYDDAVSVANGLVKEFGQRGAAQLTMQVLDWMNFQNWFSLDPQLRVHIIDILGKATGFDIAIQVFNHFINISVKKDVGMYNALLHAFSKADKTDAVLELFKEMKQTMRPNKLSYNLVMHACVKSGEELVTVVALFKDMYLKGIKPDVFSYDILMAACVIGKHAREARMFFENMKKQGLRPNVVTYSTLINVYAASGNCEAAMGALQEMVESGCKPNSVTFGSLIHGFGQEGQIGDAEKMFQMMKDVGVFPTATTYNIMINLYSKSGNQKLAQLMFHEMIEAGVEPTYVTFTSLMFCFKSACAYEEVLSIYEDVKGKESLSNIYTFTEALDACLKWGNWARAVGVLSDILESRINPTPVTCNVVLMGLSSRCSTVEEAAVLIEFLKKYDTKLILIVRYLLLELWDGDAQVEALVAKLTEVISVRDTRTWTVFSSGLIDALWALGWHHRASTVLKWTLARGYNECPCTLTNDEWKLDLRKLSVGSSLVAFHHWLKWLEEAAAEDDRRGQARDAEVEGTGAESRRAGDSLAGMEIARRITRGELVFPFERLVEASQGVRFPRIVTVVTGWGKYSKVEGGSLVREAVHKEIVRLRLPFKHSSGAWVAYWDLLRMWLRDGGDRLLVCDAHTGSSSSGSGSSSSSSGSSSSSSDQAAAA